MILNELQKRICLKTCEEPSIEIKNACKKLILSADRKFLSLMDRFDKLYIEELATSSLMLK